MMTTKMMIECLYEEENPFFHEVADRLEDLTQFINDMTNDHYTDYLDWYAQRCWKLEEENERLKEGRK